MTLFQRTPVQEQLNYPGSSSRMFFKYCPVRYVSKPLRSEPCPYDNRVGFTKLLWEKNGSVRNYLDANNTRLAATKDTGGLFAAEKAMALNRSYERFKQAVGHRAEIGVNLAEREQAVSMIANRCGQMIRSFRALRRGRFDDFIRELGVTRLKGHRGRRWSRRRDASSLWLEYHFGWKPLIQDIHDGVEILQSPFPYSRPVQGTGSAFGTETRRVGDPETYAGSFRFVVRMGARVSVTNANLHRASQLGLTNPAAIAWELIPFSFLVDWFIPVGNFLNSWSDFHGLSFEKPYTTRYGTYVGTCYRYMYPAPWDPNDFVADAKQFSLQAYGMTRTLGLSGPVVYPKVFKGFSVTRAATAVALLITTFVS